MAIWSRCSGSFTIPRNSKFSLRKYVENKYDEITWRKLIQENSSYDTDIIQIEFDFVFSLDGIIAAKFVDGLASTLIAIPGYVWSNIEAEIRFT